MLQDVLTTMFEVLVPLSLPVIAGVLLVRLKHIETGHILTMVLYFFTPVLVYHTLSTADISLFDISKTVQFCALNLFLLWAAARIFGKLFKLPSPQMAGLTLVSTLTNSINYGLPLVLLTFGSLGLDKASVYVIIQMLITNTFGVFFAARSRFSVVDAVKSVFRLPAVYAAALAVFLRWFDLSLPDGVVKGIAMTTQAYSPLVLTVLGTQMANVKTAKLARDAMRAFTSGLTIRMLLSPLLAFAGLHLLGIDGLLFSVLFILACMPVSVNSVILAEKFDAASEVVSKCILWTTLASFVVLPFLIELVR